MATLSEGGLSDQQEGRFLSLLLTGLCSQMQEILMNFGDLFESWHHGLFLPISTVSRVTPIGTIDPRDLSTARPLELSSTYQKWRDSLNGYVTTCLEMM